jgi:hypothetical protein
MVMDNEEFYNSIVEQIKTKTNGTATTTSAVEDSIQEAI